MFRLLEKFSTVTRRIEENRTIREEEEEKEEVDKGRRLITKPKRSPGRKLKTRESLLMLRVMVKAQIARSQVRRSSILSSKI